MRRGMDDTTQAVMNAADEIMATLHAILADSDAADDIGEEPTGELEALLAALPPPVEPPLRIRPTVRASA